MTRSKYFLLFCIAFIFGIFFGSYFSIQVWILFLLAGFSIALVFLFKKNKKLKVLFLLLIFILLGFARVESEKLNKVDILKIDELNNKEISISGKISLMPEIRNGKQKIIIEDVKDKTNDKEIKGKIIIYTDRYPEYDLGDIIEVDGKVKIPEDFEGFEYRNYLLAREIYYVMYYSDITLERENESGFYAQVSKLRKQSDNLIKKIFFQPQAGIISAMTLAIKSDINEEVLETFNKTGTRHIIAISGMHMAIVGLALMYILLAIGLNRNHAFYFALLGIIFFVILVGFPSSAVRAMIMASLALLAERIGRLKNAGNAIVFAGVLMLLFSPNLLRYDTGFQLSFAAVLGIIYIFPKFDLYFKKYSDRLKIKTMFLITISAQIATLPIIISNFGNFSLLSVFANILILPFVPIVMLGGLLLIVVGFANLSVAQILAWPIHFILFYQVEVIKIFASFDFGYLSFENLSIWFIVIYYLILVLLISYKSKKYK
ncbi:MAG: ComEC/Rec2 family competence protein [Patescibacteria group bacterium]|nr:ComEC/Rec2 family competence protein [Patescibacteria group bacterium]